MLKKIKKRLGYIKRGLIGYVQNNFEKTPKFPQNIKNHIIGKSGKGKDIECYQIGAGSQIILYAFGLHGNEIGTIKLAYNFINWIYQNQNKLENYTLFIIPCLNPDGYELALKNPDYFNGGRFGRFNANNVDLNRNFDTPNFNKKSVWSFGKDYSDTLEVYCGEYGNSESETKSLTDFVRDQNVRIIFMFHNAGKYVMGNKNELSQKLTKLFARKTGFGYVSNEDWEKLNQTGTMKEWCDINHVAYIEIEGSTRWGSDWDIQKEAIKTTLFTI